jgi:glycosyltransferase involved in cell wall biosynthesis
MRIAHITATFPPYAGGSGNVCYYNARELTRRGHDVHVYTAPMSGLPNVELIEGMQVHRLWAMFQIGNAPFLPGLLKLRGFDIIHLHYPFIFGSDLIWFVTRFSHIPYVFTYHNDLIGNGMRGVLFETYLSLSAPLTFAGATRLFTVSKDHAENCKLTPLFKKRWNYVIEIPNGIDETIFNSAYDGGKFKRQQKIPETAKVILFVGGLDRAHHYKGVDILLEAFARIAYPESWLLIVGDGDLRSGFIGQANILNVMERTVFAGQLHQHELPQAIAAADMLVLPSFAESFGMALIEAMACGKPVIASNLPGVRTVVANGKDGLLVTPGNPDELAAAIQSLLDNPGECIKMGLSGQNKVIEKYSWTKIVDRLEHAYKSVLDIV